ncbi:MAG TPA: hypothetical protein PK605_06390 [Ignavibacteria bacterium]|nr:hypothetical protein [Ignavibacteria bacterium]HRF65184.1 hypothetical protein [Ignavibacteria bacterium]HRJ04014.1 hypothetical protein [Ignavibacteria bacterium]HRJ86226.1 hypothetical protein [Ignavibacteria bacterium]
MRKILIILLLVTASTTFAQLVKKGETEIFRFKTSGGKTAVICTGDSDSYIVYRFGTNGKVELVYPAAMNIDSWQLFTYSYYFRGGGKENAGLDLNYLSFENNGYLYKLYQEYSAEAESESAGIIVTGANGIETDFKAVSNSVKGSLVDLRYMDKLKREQ